MMLTFKAHEPKQRGARQSGDNKKQKAGNTKISPEFTNDISNSNDAPSRSVSEKVDHILKETKDAAQAQQAHTKRRQSVAINSTNARLAIRKKQLELKVKRSHALEKVALFQSLTQDIRNILITKMKLKIFEDGDEICAEGDEAKRFFIVAHLEDEAYIQVTGRKGTDFAAREVELSRLGLFDFVGEAALIEGGFRTATARAVGRVETLSLSRSNWNTLREDGVLGGDVAAKVEANAAKNQEELKNRSNGDGDDASIAIEDDDGSIAIEDDNDESAIIIADY